VRGWFGMRLDRAATDWDEVERSVGNSYRLTAPKTLLHRLPEET